MCDRWIFLSARVKGADANPVHLAMNCDLLLADDRNIIFCLTGDGAGVAADAHIEVNHHAPFVAFVRKLRGVIECLILCRKLFRFLRKMRVSEKLRERAGLQNAAALDLMMLLRANEPLASSDFSNR